MNQNGQCFDYSDANHVNPVRERHVCFIYVTKRPHLSHISYQRQFCERAVRLFIFYRYWRAPRLSWKLCGTERGRPDSPAAPNSNPEPLAATAKSPTDAIETR
ncbi:hypothetical protein TcasGA2_TC001284 [Tribolium castaneum]|uniref:Uncharacterized protein n=1 Tax=Tribolium castaneum TaxID=7070 RepID=D6WBP2_TRICA|nr:hypothetical protein TcasGA2_TC001284 [Tribolium castaneum]